jgi:hypothetical protein
MVAAGLLILFLIGLPVSFGIGALLGLSVYHVHKNRIRENRGTYVILGGALYILGQPLSVLFMWLLGDGLRKIDAFFGWEIPMEGFSRAEMLYAILFCLLFTVGILVATANSQRRDRPVRQNSGKA